MSDKDLYEQIAETMRSHELTVVINDQERPGYRIRHDACTCGWVNRYFQDPDGFVDHTAQAVCVCSRFDPVDELNQPDILRCPVPYP